MGHPSAPPQDAVPPGYAVPSSEPEPARPASQPSSAAPGPSQDASRPPAALTGSSEAGSPAAGPQPSVGASPDAGAPAGERSSGPAPDAYALKPPAEPTRPAEAGARAPAPGADGRPSAAAGLSVAPEAHRSAADAAYAPAPAASGPADADPSVPAPGAPTPAVGQAADDTAPLPLTTDGSADRRSQATSGHPAVLPPSAAGDTAPAPEAADAYTLEPPAASAPAGHGVQPPVPGAPAEAASAAAHREPQAAPDARRAYGSAAPAGGPVPAAGHGAQPPVPSAPVEAAADDARHAYGSAAPAGGPAQAPGHGVQSPVPGAPVAPHPYAPVPAPVGYGYPAAPLPPAGHGPGPGLPPGPGGPWQYDPWAAAGGRRPEEKADGKPVSRSRIVTGALIVALVAGGIGGGIGAWLERDGGPGHRVTLPQAPADKSDRDPGSIAGIAARALPGVVTLHVRGSGGQGTGTGFVLDTKGHILTNNHVVEPAGGSGEIQVTFNGGQTAKATVVGRDSGYDLAVVKVKNVSGLTPLPLGNSDSVHVGDSVVAIGAPFDLAGTVTTGIISAKARPITAGGKKGDGSDVSYVDALQTDAPINPGNSGGPLVDSRGRVIGINSAIRSAGGSSESGGQGGSIGLGFAIPINQAKRVAEELINTGRATHPVIGVSLDMEYQGDGARVNPKGGSGTPVTPNGPADKAGIEPGDVIKKVDDVPVHSGQELIVKIRSHRPGDRLALTVERDGKERTIRMTLGTASSS
ncbi:trypsin-like peptidase domain-containing protein [Streptomyces sp. URMC 126]|uniref:S1C family serine protease n=1 Tax=Streptomyces sp. URMC 126 TaxID=3423401 RepID=UPI003F1B90AF